MTRMRPVTAGPKASSRAAVAARAPAGLWAPSSTVTGWRVTTSSRPGRRRPANASATTSAASGAPKNASTAARATAALSPW